MAINQVLLKTVRNILKSGLTIRLMSDGNLEPKLKGYSPRKLAEKDWKLLTGTKKISAVAQWVKWEFQEGGADIYGFIVKDRDGALLWAESYKDGPYQILRKGDILRVRPKMVFEETG